MASLERSLKYILIGTTVVIATLVLYIIYLVYHLHLFLASEDLPDGPALVIFQWQDLTFRCCPWIVLATVTPAKEDW